MLFYEEIAMYFHAETEISASPERVWEILSDAANHPQLDPIITRVEGKFGLQEKITVHVKNRNKVEQFVFTVAEFVPNQRMTWTIKALGGLLKAVRAYELEPTSKGVKFKIWAEYEGLLVPIFRRGLPDFNPIFAEFAAALKKRAEG
jgi:hypothetical protein